MSNPSGLKFPNFPKVIRHKINDWKILRYTQNDWISEFQNKLLYFRQGKKCVQAAPHWEQLCDKKLLTLKEFFENSIEDSESWLYFDYKFISEVFPLNSDIYESIRWSDLNLKNCESKDSAIWIGNKGAHTPCHMDTYGCNFVAQIFGRKLWILIPPNETDALKAVRVPYEESSIFSSLNFYTPNLDLLRIKEAYGVILSPGEVLYVPRHWWHYVENLEVSISINTWVPLDIDHESRLEECLVRNFIFNICKDLSVDEAVQLLNPNEHDLLMETSLLPVLNKCVENCIKYRKTKSSEAVDYVCYYEKFMDESLPIQKFDLQTYVSDKSCYHHYDPHFLAFVSEELTSQISLTKKLINAFGNPKNLQTFKEILLHQFEQ